VKNGRLAGKKMEGGCENAVGGGYASPAAAALIEKNLCAYEDPFL